METIYPLSDHYPPHLEIFKKDSHDAVIVGTAQVGNIAEVKRHNPKYWMPGFKCE